LKRRSAVLFLRQHQRIRLDLALDREAAGQGGKGAIFRRIGDKFVEGQRQCLRGRGLQLDLRAVERDLMAGQQCGTICSGRYKKIGPLTKLAAGSARKRHLSRCGRVGG
jgi:hypothetical protein